MENFYHYKYEAGFVGTAHDEDIDLNPVDISRFVFAFNIMRKIGIELGLTFSTYAVDYHLTILCFNINGHLFYVRSI